MSTCLHHRGISEKLKLLNFPVSQALTLVFNRRAHTLESCLCKMTGTFLSKSDFPPTRARSQVSRPSRAVLFPCHPSGSTLDLLDHRKPGFRTKTADSLHTFCLGQSPERRLFGTSSSLRASKSISRCRPAPPTSASQSTSTVHTHERARAHTHTPLLRKQKEHQAGARNTHPTYPSLLCFPT